MVTQKGCGHIGRVWSHRRGVTISEEEQSTNVVTSSQPQCVHTCLINNVDPGYII